MRKFWLLLSILFIWTCGGGGGSKAPTEPVEPAPVSNFTATPTSGLQPLEVVFTSTATGTIASYAWNVDADTDIEGTAATFTHTYTDAGTYDVTLTVAGPGGSNPKTVADMITVTSAAPTPTTATTHTTQEDGSTTISLTATDPNGQAVTFAITTDPTNGTATLSGTEITYTPNANFYGTDSFDYTASNGTYTSDPVTITITVTGEDDGNPTTNDVSATTDEDTAVTIDLDATEIDGDNYSFTIVTQPTNGTLGSVSGNQVEYTPNANWNGTDTFTFEATDDRTSRRNVATATITVNAVNDAPEANDVTASMDENKIVGRYQPVTITLDATDVDGDALTYFKQSDPSNGTLGTITNNQVVYTPTQDFNGEDTFIYKATDGNADSNGATVTITIASVNDAPIANNISTSASSNVVQTTEITLDALDVDGDILTYSIVSNVSNGVTSLSGSVVSYTPILHFDGTDIFTYKVNDGNLDSNIATVTITVENFLPTITYPVGGESFSSKDAINITWDNGFNNTGIQLLKAGNKILDISGDAGNVTNYQWSIPTTIPTGSDYAIKIYDGGEGETEDISDSFSITNNHPITITYPAGGESFNKGDAINITWDNGFNNTGIQLLKAGNKILDISGDAGNVTNYQWSIPTSVAYGSDYAIKIYDAGTGDMEDISNSFVIANNAPIAANFEVNTNEELPINFTFNLTDPDGDENLTISLTENPLNGSLTQNTLTEYRYTPNTNFSGTDSFKYTVSDGSLTSSEATVTLKVSNPFYEILFDSNTQALSVLNKGSYIIIGNSDGGAKKYDSDMNEIWTIDDNNADNPVKIKEHSDGTIYLLSSDKIAKYSSSGSLEWGNDLNMDQARDFILVDDGIIIGGHKSIDSWNSYLATEKLSYSDGSSIWIKEHTAYTSNNWKVYHPNASIFQSSSGDIFFASDNKLMKFTSSQPIPSWVKTLSSGWVHQAAISPNDEIILIKDTGSQDSHYELYDLSGNLISSQRISNLMSTWGNGNAKKTLSSTVSNDGVFYAVTYDGDWGGLDLIKYDGSDLTAFRRIELYSTDQIGWSNLGEMYYPASIDVDSETVIHIFNFKNNPFNSQSRVPLLIKTDLNGNILIP